MCADVLIAHAGAELYGSDRMVVESVAAFVNDGKSVTVTVPKEGPLIELLTDAGAEVLVCESPVINKSLLSPKGMLKLVTDTWRALPINYRLVRKYATDVVLVNTITAPLWLPVAKLARKKVVCHVHEAEGSARKVLKRALYLPLIFADRLVVNSRFALGVLSEGAPWLASRAQVVYNAVAGPTQPSPAQESLDFGVRLLFLGRLSARKGPDVVIDAVKLLVDRGIDVQLSLLGEVFTGNEAFKEQLENQVNRLGIQDRVEFLGFHPSIWPHVAEHDIICVPSTVDEPFGNTAVEAILAQRPLVVSAIAGLLEASEGFEAAVPVPPSQPVDFADAVEYIVKNWPKFRQAAITDCEKANQKFSSNRYAEQLRELVLGK